MEPHVADTHKVRSRECVGVQACIDKMRCSSGYSIMHTYIHLAGS